jgi:hypothetical protein
MYRAALLLLALSATVPAMETDPVPDMQEYDKQMHALMGVAAAGMTDAGLSLAAPILPDWTQRPWVRRLAPLAGSLVVGVLKEVYDDHHSDEHSSEWSDVTATVVGGAGYSLVFSWRF